MKDRRYKIRSRDGKYDYTNLDLFCTCGHKLGIHAGDNETKKRPCFNEDSGIEGTTAEYCPCKNFRKSLQGSASV